MGDALQCWCLQKKENECECNEETDGGGINRYNNEAEGKEYYGEWRGLGASTVR